MSKNVLIILFCILLGAIGVYLLLGEESGEVNQNNNEEIIMQNEELKTEVLEAGDGDEVVGGEVVTVHYVGMLEDGTLFDSSVERGMPFTFTVGAGQVIQGWDEGLIGMKIGEKRKLTIPSEMGYGERGAGVIPPNATLIFEVELLEIN